MTLTAPVQSSPRDAPIAPPDGVRLRRAMTVLSSIDRRMALFEGLDLRDPAWAMLMDLYVAHRQGDIVSVSSLSVASRAPNTTALRWQLELIRCGLCERSDDDRDGRRVHVRLTARGVELIERWLDEWRD